VLTARTCRRHVNTDPGVAPKCRQGVRIQAPLTSCIDSATPISQSSHVAAGSSSLSVSVRGHLRWPTTGPMPIGDVLGGESRALNLMGGAVPVRREAS
jgi:hypothetical protein